MVNVGAAKIVSSKVKARAINTNSWLLELFLSLECHNITSTVNLLAYELTLLWYHQQTCKLIKDFSLPTFFWFGKLSLVKLEVPVIDFVAKFRHFVNCIFNKEYSTAIL